MGRVIIAGGGLAGLSLAMGLRLRGVSVEVHEAGSYPRHRVCGEFISGVETSTLESLGIDADFEDAERHSRVVWFREGRTIFEGSMPSPALGISRHRLDLRLRDRVVAAGGQLSREPEPENGEPPHLAMCVDTDGNELMLTRKRGG